MIYLLDLNYTLVANSHAKAAPFSRQIEQERYREWLVALLQPVRVLLVTARPERYRAATLESIRKKTGWEPEAAFFNDLGLPPPELKERLLRERIRPAYGDGPYLALESNPATRAMYARHGVRAFPVPKDVQWEQLPR